MTIETEKPTTTPIDETPNKTVDLTTTTPIINFELNTDTPSTAVVSEPAKEGQDSKAYSPVTDVQKKIRRVERFGVQVQLSEKEKRNSRAARFGTSSTINKSETSNNAEEIKRKARAERFWLPVPPMASEEEAKKNARLARFAPYSKPDSQEDDKRKARVLRFSKPSSNPHPQVIEKASFEQKETLLLQLHKTEPGKQEHAEFLHLPKKKFSDFGM